MFNFIPISQYERKLFLPTPTQFQLQSFWPSFEAQIKGNFLHKAIFPSIINQLFAHYWVSLMAQTVKNLPAKQETQVWSLGGEDPLEKKTATHSNILVWRNPWTEEPGRLQSIGHKELDTTERLTVSLFHLLSLQLLCISQSVLF